MTNKKNKTSSKKERISKRKKRSMLIGKNKHVNKKIYSKVKKNEPAYFLNTDFGSFYELRELILKSLPAEKDDMVAKINKLGKIRLAIISGIFINKENHDPLVADLLIVGDYVENRKVKPFLKSLEAEVGKEVKYSIMDKEEFQYRLAMFDRFVRVLLDGPHEKLINKLGI